MSAIAQAAVTLSPRPAAEEVTRAQLHALYDTNVFGVVAVTNALLPLLRKASAARIVNISSSLGSLAIAATAENFPPSLTYGTSKTAVNSVTVQYARALAGTAIKVNAACPGFIATDLNQHTGTGTPAEGARIALTLATLDADGPTGRFFDSNGPVAW